MPTPPAARIVQLRRGTAAENDSLTGAPGEVTVDLDNKNLRVHDGIRQGGYAVRRDDKLINRQFFISFRTAVVQQGVATLAMATLHNPPKPVAMITAGGVATAVAQFEQNARQELQGSFPVAANWPGTPVQCKILWRVNNTTSPVNWQLYYGGLEDGELLDTFSFTGPQVFSPYIPAEANVLHTSIITLEDHTGVVPGGEFFFKIRRENDAVAAPAELLSIRFVFDRQGF